MLKQTKIETAIEKIIYGISEQEINNTYIVGTISNEPTEIKKGILETSILSKSAKGLYDLIPLRMPSDIKIEVGKKYRIKGESRSEGRKNSKIERYLWVTNIEQVAEATEYYNYTILKGSLCKKTNVDYNVNHKAVCRAVLCIESKKTARHFYIPIICWHNQAYRISNAEIGSIIEIRGWLQARIFEKDGILHNSYEVSANVMKIFDE